MTRNGPTPGQLAAQRVAAGEITQEQAEAGLGLLPGERLLANGVVSGSGACRGIPRHGADETDLDDIPGAQDAGWADYWDGKAKFRDGE